MKLAIALILFLHGIAHLVGFAAAFKLGKDIPHRTTLLAGHIDVGEGGIRTVGILWAALAAGFALASAGVMFQAPWALPVVAAATALSLALCSLNLPDAKIGLALNVVIVLVLIFARLSPAFR